MSLERPTVREALLETPPGAEAEAVREAFFRRLRLPGGVTKRTRPGRLADLDRRVMPLLPRDRPLELMDVGISSGVTTLDWARALRQVGLEFSLLGGDLTPHGWLVRVGGGIEALIDDQLRLLQLDLWGRGVPGSAPGFLGLLPALAERWVRFRLSFEDGLSRTLRLGRPPGERWSRRLVRVALTAPELASEPAIRVIEDDLSAPPNPALEGRFDAVRVANLLNRDYFSEERLATMLRVVANRVKPGGLLLLCRTEPDDTNHATVLRRSEEGAFEPVARLGRGSEVEGLGLQAAVSAG